MKHQKPWTTGKQCSIISHVGSKRIYRFEADKNTWLIQNRGVSFEQIIAALENQGAIAIVEHPNTERYAHQKMYLAAISNYVYLVPFIEETSNEIFLKTAFPSRKATKEYLTKLERKYHAK